jgi:hypothetical protein
MKSKLMAACAALIIVGATTAFAAPPAYERPHTKDYREKTGRKQSVYDDERQASNARAKASRALLQGSDSALFMGPDGRLYSEDYLDQLRGQHAGRTEEAHRFARDVMAKASSIPYTEIDPETRARTRYTGVVRVMHWEKKPNLIARLFGAKTQRFYTAARQVQLSDGMGWQGPNPPIGYYSAKKFDYEYLGGSGKKSGATQYAAR